MALRHAGPGGDSSLPSPGPSSPAAAVGSPGHVRAHPTPIEGLIGRTSASFRRRMVLGTAVGVVVLAGVAVLFAWRQYDRAKSSALSDLQARVASVGGVVDVSFTGDIALLRTAAQSPVVVSGDLVGMHRYFGAVETSSGSVFSGGLAWVDREGDVEVRGTAEKSSPINVGGRDYFRQVLLTGEPYVSPGLVGKLTRKPLVAIAVPTFNASGGESGVLVGSILLGPTRESPEALSLGFGGLDLIDRDGRLLLSNLAPVVNRALVAQMSRIGSGVIAGTPGLDGRGSDVVAFALSPVSGWMVVIDQSESSVFASARRALVLDLTSVGGGGLLLLAILTLVALRTRREAEVQDARARAWGALTRTLAAASTPPEVAAALLDALHDALPDSLSVVGFERDDRLEVTAASPPTYGRRLVEDQPMLDEIARRGLEGRRSQPLDQTPELRLAYTLSGRRLRTLHTLPVVGDGGRPLGSISVLSAQARLASGEWALLESFADQAAVALGRAQVFEREHELAVRLQRNLLPDRLPSAEGVELAGHYHAGAAAVEVGGDWYDAARRPDGILELCVGDVSGRGIGAATIMGRQRNIFHAYAFESPSPAEIIRRMLRHVDTDDMITVACVALDLYTGELAYACAGHPPPLLLDHATGQTRRLDQASAPPIGVAEPSDIVEAQIRIDGAATLALYTDGLVERRGASIDDGIDLLARVLGSVPDPTPDVVLEQVSAGIGEPVDDVALLIVRLDARQAPFELEVPADPAGLPAIRRRLRGWLERELVGSEEAAEVVLAVSEACNNAIEHAYPGGGGTLGVWVTREAERLRVVVEDRGSWREERPSDDRGRGLSLMRQLMDTVEIETGPRGTRITLERRLAAATGAAGLARSGVPR